MSKTRLVFYLGAIFLGIAASAAPAFAHGGTGEYAGTHVVALAAEPRSPFAGETVKMVFYLRDLRRIIEENPFTVSVEIQKDTPDGEETIFSTEPACALFSTKT